MSIKLKRDMALLTKLGNLPEELVPINHEALRSEYYVALLSAPAYFGATYQKPTRFQVI